MTLGRIKRKLERLSILGNEPLLGNSDGNILAQEALAELNTYMEKLESKELVEEVAKGLYKEMPWTYEDRVPTTMITPAYEMVTKSFTWEELDEADYMVEHKDCVRGYAKTVLNVIKEK